MLTTNVMRKSHWTVRAEATRLWREASGVLARANHLPHFARAEVAFEIEQTSPTLCDAVSHHPVTKAVVDGLVDAGVLDGDGPEHVTAVIHYAPTRAEADVVIVHLKGVLDA